MKRTSFWHKFLNFELLRAPEGEGAPGGDNPPADPPATPPADPPAGDPPATPPADPPAAPDLSFIGDDYRTDGQPDVDRFGEHYQELLAEQARRQEQLAEVPEDGVYDFTVPEDFDLGVELPDGVEIQAIDPNDEAMAPLFSQLGTFLKENNLPKSAGGQVMGLLKKYEATKLHGLIQQQDAEWQTLGANDAAREARVATVQRALDAKLPADQAAALKKLTYGAAPLKALEALVSPRGPRSGATVLHPKSVEEDLEDYYATPSK
ncbi:MAG: hypothetical protein GYB53_18045 [Rhodobacteraceae bacterium]|nr:hypothetical protein [Paracoccaceae bacterium]MBR9823021.1 hypothetical protein [Paracoccaceae bacterium]